MEHRDKDVIHKLPTLYSKTPDNSSLHLHIDAKQGGRGGHKMEPCGTPLESYQTAEIGGEPSHQEVKRNKQSLSHTQSPYVIGHPMQSQCHDWA